MTERKFYKEAYKLIFREGKAHQEVYDQYVKETQLGPETVARVISMVPSKAKNESIKPLWIAFIAIIIGMAVLRIAVLFQYDQITTGTMWTLIFASLAIVFAPFFGIIGALNGKAYYYGGASFLTVVALIRGFVVNDFGTETMHYTYAGFAIMLFILGGLIPRRLRAGYTKLVVDKEKEDGKIVKRITYTFDESKKMTRKEILKENF